MLPRLPSVSRAKRTHGCERLFGDEFRLTAGLEPAYLGSPSALTAEPCQSEIKFYTKSSGIVRIGVNVNRFYVWFKNKLGRLITALGGLLAVADLDISPIQSNLEAFLSHKQVQAVTVALFLASYFRHQFVASRHPEPSVLPPPTPESSR